MFSRTFRSTTRHLAPRVHNASSRRFITAGPAAPGTWKGTVARWTTAIGVVYYYNTSTLFAESEEEAAIERLDQSIHHIQESPLPTLEAIKAERQARREEVARKDLEKERELEGQTPLADEEKAVREDEASIEGLEEEADQQGAFNPETGEINWDCPCLGGMAHGPCGEEFRAAFSCFVYSNEEPKGVECIEKFKGMQDCFRAHPEMYASELEEDEVEEGIEEQRQQRAAQDQATSSNEGEAATHEAQASTEAPKQPVAQSITTTKEAPVSTSHIDASNGTPDTKHHGDEGGELTPRDHIDYTENSFKSK